MLLIIVVKNVKGDILKNLFIIMKSYDILVNKNSLMKMVKLCLFWVFLIFGVFFMLWKVMENIIILKIICRNIGMINIRIWVLWLRRKYFFFLYLNCMDLMFV